MLKHRARAGSDVCQHVTNESAATIAASVSETSEKSLSGRDASVHRIGEHRNRVDLRRRSRCDVENRLFDTQPRRLQIPRDSLLEVRSAMDHNTRPLRELPIVGDHNVDCRACIRENRRVAERGRVQIEHSRPRALTPRERSGVIDVDACENHCPITTPNKTTDVVRRVPAFDGLSARDDAVLHREDIGDVQIGGRGHARIVANKGQSVNTVVHRYGVAGEPAVWWHRPTPNDRLRVYTWIGG